MIKDRTISKSSGPQRAFEASIWVALAALTVIIPNAFKEVAAGFLIVATIYYVTIKGVFLSRILLGLWLSIAIVTAAYILVGTINGAPPEAAKQVVIIYIISPLLWTISIRGALRDFPLSSIVNFLIIMTVVAILSQAFYYWSFMTGRFSHILDIMAGNANVDFSGNEIAAVMFVFGSMIFLYAGYFASTEVIERKPVRWFVMVAMLISAVTSGRSALLLSIAMGVVLAALLSTRSLLRAPKGLVAYVSILPLVAFAGHYILSEIYGINLALGFETLVEKIASGGGAGRQDYMPQLLEGAMDYAFLGAGHGIGVEYIASGEFPWRYEVVGAATLYRTGIFGLLIYSLPFLVALKMVYVKYSRGELDKYEKYLAGGMMAALVSANTNPYIEAIVFQWMFILPTLYFIESRQT